MAVNDVLGLRGVLEWSGWVWFYTVWSGYLSYIWHTSASGTDETEQNLRLNFTIISIIASTVQT
jgi:hypothetical protein